MKTLLAALIVLVMAAGCETQSGEARYANKMLISRYQRYPEFPPEAMDIYSGQMAPNDLEWDDMAFIFQLTAKDYANEVIAREGISCDVKLDWSATYTGYTGADVFADGRGYIDFMTGIQKEYDDDEGHWYRGRTNNYGQLHIVIGCRNVDDEDWISTLAQFTARIRRNGGEPLLEHFHIVWTKVEYQHFFYVSEWPGVPGVINTSCSYLGQLSAAAGDEDNSELFIDGVGEFLTKEPEPMLPKPAFFRLEAGDCGEGITSTQPYVPASDFYFSLLDEDWWILRYTENGWYWFEAMAQDFSPYTFDDDTTWTGDKPYDGNDPNEPEYYYQQMIDWSQPFQHAALVEVSDPNTPPLVVSAILRVLEHEPGDYPDPNYWPAWDEAQQADYNMDGYVNMGDLGKIANQWLQEPNSLVFPVYLDRNQDDMIGIYELALLAGHWCDNNQEYVQSTGEVISSRPVAYQTTWIHSSGLYHELSSPYILQCDNPLFDGWYLDSWYNPYVMVYVPDGAIMSIQPVKDGDYNGDDKTNLIDYAMLYNVWQNNTLDPAYDLDHNAVVDEQDLKLWVSNWMKGN